MLSRLCASFLSVAFFLTIAFPHAGTEDCCAIEHALSPASAVREAAGHGSCCDGEDGEDGEKSGEDRSENRGGSESEDGSPPCCVFCHLNWTGIPAHSTVRVPNQDEAGAKPMTEFDTWVAGAACHASNFLSVTEPPPPRLAALLALICVRLI